MSLQFYFGGSGSGKSTALYESMIASSIQEPERNFLVIVPDQFTMQTQKELVERHPRKGIMNIDVLSFGRLTYRILEEVGREEKPILDDTGKNLVLRSLALKCKEELPLLGKHLEKTGYIHEVKSVLSEFMQYGIGEGELEELIAFSKPKGALHQKLQELALLYRRFQEYLGEKYITTEETLDVLCKMIPRSAILQNSVVAFDGFTGFTPVQDRVIRQLLKYSAKVIFSMTLDGREDPYQVDGEQRLFHLSKVTVDKIERIAFEERIEREQDVILNPTVSPRFVHNPELASLERNLFRYPAEAYPEKPACLHVMSAENPKEEIRQVCRKIRELLRKGYYYRDIAVISGNLSAYQDSVETEFRNFGIPVFLDETRGILLNPFIELIRGAIGVVEKNFSEASVISYLRSGLTSFSQKEVDEIELYLHAYGIHGLYSWRRSFTARKKRRLAAEELLGLNELRERLLSELEPLLNLTQKATARSQVEALYEYILSLGIAGKIEAMADAFREEGDLAKAREYSQIYRLTMDLLNQIYDLLGDEVLEVGEFLEILEAGFSEIEVGSIPQNVDRVLVGDMERTRLHGKVKALFLIGANDGNIPKSVQKGGLISDLDREFLVDSGKELAPSPRQQMYIQRLYLYINMTKPSDFLCLSYSKVSNEGEAMRASYLIGTIQKLFPLLKEENPGQDPVTLQAETLAESRRFLADGLRGRAAGIQTPEQREEYEALLTAYAKDPEYGEVYRQLLDRAFYSYKEEPLSRQITELLYGHHLLMSVSRLEKYAGCAYAYFLQYGLKLQEKQEAELQNIDIGNIFHGVLELFSKGLQKAGENWKSFSKEIGEKILTEALEQYLVTYGEQVLYTEAVNRYAIREIKRIMLRSIQTLQYQIRKGGFTPTAFELSFGEIGKGDGIRLSLSENRSLTMTGKIDRIDTCENQDEIYVKVLDYKSGKKDFDLVSLYEGTSLQLMVYMNAGIEHVQQQNPGKNVVPGALLYYRVQDPMIEANPEESSSQIEQKILENLRTTGIVSSNMEIVRQLDTALDKKSDVIPITLKKDGSFAAGSHVLEPMVIEKLAAFANVRVRELGEEILEGNKACTPLRSKNSSACEYCSYQGICGYEKNIPGFTEREETLSEDQCLEKILERMEDKNGFYEGTTTSN